MVDCIAFSPADARQDLAELPGLAAFDQEEVVKEMRERCQILIALGDCAVFGGIVTMRNFFDMDEALKRAYVETESTVDGKIPCSEELGRPVRVCAVNNIVKVDIHIPGCPPSPDAIYYALSELLEGRIPALTGDYLKYD